MKLLKNIIPGMIIIIILALFCTQLQNNKEQLRHTVQFNKLYQASHTPYPLLNFVYLDTYMSVSSVEGEGTGQEKWEHFETAGSIVFLLGVAAG